MTYLFKKRISIFLVLAIVLNVANFSYADIVASNSEIVEEIENTEGFESSMEEIASESDIEEYDEEEPSNDVFEPCEEPEEDVIASDSEVPDDINNETDNEGSDGSMDEISVENVASVSDTTENDENNEVSDVDENSVIASESNAIESNDILATDSETEAATPSTVDIAFFNTANPVASDSEPHGLGFIPIDFHVPKVKKSFKSNLFGDASVPSYDSRNYGYVPPIRDQNPYNTCWAFSLMGMMEVSALKKNLVSSGENINLSELALAYFYYNLYDVTNNSSTNKDTPGIEGNDCTVIDPTDTSMDFETMGGNQLLASLTMSSYMGAVQENSDIAYNTSNMSTAKSSGLDGKYAFNSNTYEPGDVKFINKNDKNIIKKAIQEFGSVSISYHESSSYVRQDGDGMYYYYTNNNTLQPNHAVMLIGWNDNISSSKFPNSCAHNGGWLVRNSWGASRGATNANDGCFWLSYDEPSIYEDVFAMETIKKDTYKYNYHYDTTGYPAYFALENQGYTYAKRISNIFKVSDDENQSLDAISVALYSTNAKFDVEIYTSDTEMTNPYDGIKQLTQRYPASGATDSAGIYTVKLNKKIPIKKNTYYSIVIIPIASADVDKTKFFFDKTVMEPYEYEIDGITPKYYMYFVNAQSAGQSFIWQDSAWNDVNTVSGDFANSNFRIKGLTNPAYLVHFDTASGSNINDVLCPSGDKITKPSNPTRSGYSFAGWYKESTYDNQWNFNVDTVTEETTLHAKWNVYTPPIPPPYIPPTTGGSSGGGGGGGGGGGKRTADALPIANAQQAVGQETAKQSTSVPYTNPLVLSENGAFIFNVDGSWSLTLDKNNVNALATNGFYTFVTLDTTGNLKYTNYYFDEAGKMTTGWVKDALGNTYFFNNVAGALNQGEMCFGWQQIGTNQWYYFAPDGKLIKNGVTPDGKVVDENGLCHDYSATSLSPLGAMPLV